MKSIGYENEVIFPLKIELIDINKPSFFSLELNYLTCKDICIPGQAHLELVLLPGKGKLTEHSFKIEKYLSKIPFQSSNIAGLKILDVTATSDAISSLISIKSQSKLPLVNPNFFLGNEIGLPVVEPQYNFSRDRI